MRIGIEQSWLLFFLSLPTGCQVEPEVLKAPNLDELEAAYAEPTGELTLTELSEIMAELLEGPDFIEAIGMFRIFPPFLEELGQVVPDEASFELGYMELKGQASGTLRLVCLGGEQENGGEFSLSFTLDLDGLGREIWGELRGCEPGAYVQDYYNSYPAIRDALDRTRFNGSYELLLTNQEDFTLNHSRWLLAYEGEIYIDDVLIFDGRIDIEREGDITSTRIPLSNGRWIFYSVDSALVEHSLEDTSGTITCNLDKRQCTSEEHPLGDFEF